MRPRWALEKFLLDSHCDQVSLLYQAAHVKATWGQRCNKLLFMSSKEDKVHTPHLLHHLIMVILTPTSSATPSGAWKRGSRCPGRPRQPLGENSGGLSICLSTPQGEEDHIFCRNLDLIKQIRMNMMQDEADWFLKADDDTYTIVENLRFLLEDKNSSAPVYFGHKFKPYVDQGYFSGGAGYVLSKEALVR